MEIFSQRITKDYCIKIGKKIVIIGLTYILVAMPISYIQKDVMKLDSNRKIGLTHFLMMGLNTKTNGVWSGEDVSFSSARSSSTNELCSASKSIFTSACSCGVSG